MGQGAPKELGQRVQPTATEVGQAVQGQKGQEVPEVTEVEVGQGHTVQLKVTPLEAQEGKYYRVMRKPKFYICENKDADQLRGNRETDQRLCFRYKDSTIPLLSKSEISSL